MIRPVAVVLVVSLAGGACAQAPTASPLGPSPTGSVAPASPSPAPSTEPSPAPTTASVERDGVRVTIQLDRAPLPTGEETWLTTTVENTGSDDLLWVHDGCAIAVGLRGPVDGVAWRPGVAQSGTAAAFKSFLLGIDGGAVTIAFTPESFVGKGQIRCGLIAITDRIAPGTSIRQRSLWDGSAWPALGPPPAGRVTIGGSFAGFTRASDPPTVEGRPAIAVALDTAIGGERDPRLLHPPEIVDAALADPDFVRWLGDRTFQIGYERVLWFDAATRSWDVGLLDIHPEDRLHAIRIDGFSGDVLGLVDRAWDPRVDILPGP